MVSPVPSSRSRLVTFSKVALPLLLTIGLIAFFGRPKEPSPAPVSATPSVPAPSIKTIDTTIDAFLKTHWSHPIAPQGNPPAHFSALEASLQPSNCGTCHQTQFASWKHSLHSQTMSAGILWQLQLLPAEEISSCLNCHAPLAEQRALIAKELEWSNAPQGDIPAYVGDDLAHQGLVCAACHVRAHERVGPAPQKNLEGVALAHDGFSQTPAFSDSRFCSTCHQFSSDGPRTAGKLREDTYEQWRASPFAQTSSPTHCQSCHMPDRKHEWKGIHDQDMVKSALTAELKRDQTRILLRLTNTGAGHHFPTYMVPKVEVQLWLDSDGATQQLSSDIIGWQVDLNLTEEAFDTRIAAGASRDFSALLPANAAPDSQVKVVLAIAPREHYERTFEFVLSQRDQLQPKTLALLERAYREARDTRFTLLLHEQHLQQLTHSPSPRSE